MPFVSRFARVKATHVQCGFETRRVRGAASGGRFAALTLRALLPDAAPFREARLRRDGTIDRLARHQVGIVSSHKIT